MSPEYNVEPMESVAIPEGVFKTLLYHRQYASEVLKRWA